MVYHQSFATKQRNLLLVKNFLLKPFNDRHSLYVGHHIFGHNSQIAMARELLKPSPDSASLLISIKKN